MFCDVYVSKLLRYETLLYVYLMLSDATLSDVKHASQQHHLILPKHPPQPESIEWFIKRQAFFAVVWFCSLPYQGITSSISHEYTFSHCSL
jgi:hypothetical protein